MLPVWPECHVSFYQRPIALLIQDLRTGGGWFDPLLVQYSFIGLATGFISLAVNCFDNGVVRKQPLAWKEYCTEHWLKELQ